MEPNRNHVLPYGSQSSTRKGARTDTVRVQNQFMTVPTLVALLLQISLMYSHTMGPGPNSKAQMKLTVTTKRTV